MSVSLARRELSRIAPGRPCGVTIGVFDGVHRGHQHLIGVLLERARPEGLATVALTFNPHPRTVLRPGTAITYLTSLEERVEREATHQRSVYEEERLSVHAAGPRNLAGTSCSGHPRHA